MLDHLLVDLIAAVQESFDRAFLEREAVEEHFQVDVFLGDVFWEASYSLPGESQPPRVRADLAIEWPTWSQTAYRSWSMGETPSDWPEALLELGVRVQRLAQAPVADQVQRILPPSSPPLGTETLVRTATTIEEVRTELDPGSEAADVSWSIETTYEGELHFDERALEDPSALAPVVEALTGWVSSTLVRLADLPLTFLPPDPAEAS